MCLDLYRELSHRLTMDGPKLFLNNVSLNTPSPVTYFRKHASGTCPTYGEDAPFLFVGGFSDQRSKDVKPPSGRLYDNLHPPPPTIQEDQTVLVKEKTQLFGC